mmetsp:Transcript_21119/g.37817  ORF Transcript_21119/g.37817 Transcript_21119/m.37817 type:complete len:290 (+) Transcript_21119:98-967(+)
MFFFRFWRNSKLLKPIIIHFYKNERFIRYARVHAKGGRFGLLGCMEKGEKWGKWGNRGETGAASLDCSAARLGRKNERHHPLGRSSLADHHYHFPYPPWVGGWPSGPRSLSRPPMKVGGVRAPCTTSARDCPEPLRSPPMPLSTAWAIARRTEGPGVRARHPEPNRPAPGPSTVGTTQGMRGGPHGPGMLWHPKLGGRPGYGRGSVPWLVRWHPLHTPCHKVLPEVGPKPTAEGMNSRGDHEQVMALRTAVHLIRCLVGGGTVQSVAQLFGGEPAEGQQGGTDDVHCHV